MADVDYILIPILSAIVAMFVVAIIFWRMEQQSTGTPRMKEIATFIQQGSSVFIKRELKTITYFTLPLAAVLFILYWPWWQYGLSFVAGVFVSFLAITMGMVAAVRANVRTANAARTNPEKAVVIAFRGGSIIGISIIFLNLLAISIFYLLYGINPNNTEPLKMLFGFGLGTDVTALFAQLGGGIFTKGADIGADLVGKVEAKIPEDDPRNPAVIADLVGDNVGDCAGRGADLFSSGSDNLISAMLLGLIFIPRYGWIAVIFPLLTRAISLIGTIIGVYALREKGENPLRSINLSLFTTGIFCMICFYILATYVMKDLNLFYCLSIGLATAVAVSLATQYFTSSYRKPVRETAKVSSDGAALNIINGFAYGSESVAPIVVSIAVAVTVSFIVAGGLTDTQMGLYGIVAAALGMTAMRGIIMASDTFGPIVDNAGGISEMAGIEDEVGSSMSVLDSVGNVTKAITKGFAMGCALLTSLVLLFAYIYEAEMMEGAPIPLELTNVLIIAGLFIGGMLPFLFSGFAIHAVGDTAHQMVREVRRQFREIKGILEGKSKPDYATCIDISTKNALKGMVAPTFISIITPLVVGLVMGVEALAGMLIATTISGALLAVLMINTGGLLDNAKKYIEAGHYGGKGSFAHAAAVAGDTYGDPLKDTAGPSLHIMIKLANVVALIFLPLFIFHSLI